MTMTYSVEDFVDSMGGAEISASPPGANYGVTHVWATPRPEDNAFDAHAKALVAVPKSEAGAEEAQRPKRSATYGPQ